MNRSRAWLALGLWLLPLLAGGAEWEVRLAVARWRPDDPGKLLMAPQALLGKAGGKGAAAVLEGLRKHGSAAWLFEGAQAPADGAGPAKFEKNELMQVGRPGATNAMPALLRSGVQAEVRISPAAGDRLLAQWDGRVKWSPELLDRTPGLGRLVKALAAKETKADFGQGLIQAFAAGGAEALGYEYPVLKEAAFHGAQLLRIGEAAISSTVSELGGRAPEAVIWCVWVERRP